MLQTSPRPSGLAARRPRVEVAPPYEYSFGGEAVQLMERAGRRLDPWQADALELLLAVGADGKWACYEYGEIVARQNGKGAILEGRGLAGLLLLGEELIVWSAHEYKTAMEAFRRLKALLLRLGPEVKENLIQIGDIPIKVSNTNGEELFERLDTKQRLKFVARSKGSGRGFSGDVVIIDEAFAYTRHQQEALMPTMNSVENAQIIYTSSPPLDGASGEPLFSLRSRAMAGEESIGWREWGAEGDLDHLEQIDLDDRQLWAATNPALGGRITEKTLATLRRSMSPTGFAREILCIWPVPLLDGGAIDPKKWASLADPESRRVGDITLGVDIAPQRDYAAISVYGKRADGLGHVQVVAYQSGTAWLVGRILELWKALGPIAVGMGRGTYESVKDDLAKGQVDAPKKLALPKDPEKPERGDLAVTTAGEMSAACGQLLDATRDGTCRYIPSQPLDASVAGAKTRQVGDTIAWARKDTTSDTCPVVSVTVARWAYESRAHLVRAAGDSFNIW